MRVLFISLLLSTTANFVVAQPLKVMTYNIRYDTPADSVNQWTLRKDKVFALIRKYDPDFLGIQEALHRQVVDLLENLPEYVSVGVGRDDGKTRGEYAAILFKKDRFTAVRQNTFWLSETPDVPGSKSWDAAITRIASWGQFKDKTTGAEFLFINTHFDHIGKESRRKSAELLKQQATALGATLPLIITGDFNCTREEPPYAAITNPQGTVLFDPAPDSPPGTFCSFTRDSMPCRAIDYIFHSGAWKPLGYQVIQDHDGKYYPSDHLPVLTTLQLKE
jgi:endonuclease/exonuclease/phosphatase family metal-dependent hydrolase